MRLIDTHCHLNDAKAFPDPAGAVREANEAGVGRMIVV
ncbi:MAG: TatD family hydrolase, partial [Armatimonadetes bacterium]|nr:TatD family hydrolase [Armatimonadota bacterium]